MKRKTMEGDFNMATKSFYKNITISDKKTCRSLVSALEEAKRNKGKKVEITQEVSTIKRNELKEFFSTP